jgi:glycosyltransferase involved in cell wall biosynthesis
VANYLFINYEYPPIGGGAGTACQQIARVFSKRGHHVVVLTAGFGPLQGETVEDGVTIVRIRSARKSAYQSGIFEMLSYTLMACRKAVGIGDAHRIDSTLAFFSVPGGIVTRWLHLRRRIPYVVSLRGGDVPGTEPHLGVFYSVLRSSRHDILRHAQAVCAPSRGLKELSEKTDPFAVQIVPNGVDTELFYPDSGRRAKVPTLLSVGRLHAQKNVGYLLNLVAALKNKTEIRARVIGDGPERPSLEANASSLGIRDYVQFDGWLPREAVREAYRSATLLIHASNYEGMSNVILEALASGLPAVASHIPENRELVRDGTNGFLFDPAADPDQLVRRISSLLQNQSEWERLSEAARATIETRFSWDHAADLYERLLSNRTTADERRSGSAANGHE